MISYTVVPRGVADLKFKDGHSEIRANAVSQTACIPLISQLECIIILKISSCYRLLLFVMVTLGVVSLCEMASATTLGVLNINGHGKIV